MDIFNYVFLLGFDHLTIAVSCPEGMLEELRRNGTWPRVLGPPPTPEPALDGFSFDGYDIYFWPEDLIKPSTSSSITSSSTTTTPIPTTTTTRPTTTTTKSPPTTSSAAPRTTTTLKTLSLGGGVLPSFLTKYTKSEMPFIIRMLYWTTFLNPSLLAVIIKNGIIWMLHLIILLLTRQKFVESIGTRLFAYHYTGFAFFQTSFYLFIQIPYDYNWRKNWIQNAQCKEVYSTGKISFINDPYKEFYNNRFSFFTSGISRYFSNFLPILMTSQLVFHRINVYLAFTNPIWFKETVTPKLLHTLYFSLDIVIIVVFSALYCSYFHSYSMHNSYYKISDGIIIFITVSHFLITILSIKVVMKYRKTRKNAIREIKSFLWFSILPVTSGMLVMILAITTGKNSFFGLFIRFQQAAFLQGSIHTFIAVVREILSYILEFVPPLMFFICIPAYRKALIKVILFWRKRNQIIPIGAQVPTIRSGELSLASNFVQRNTNQEN